MWFLPDDLLSRAPLLLSPVKAPPRNTNLFSSIRLEWRRWTLMMLLRQVHAHRRKTVSCVLSLRHQVRQHPRTEAAQAAGTSGHHSPVSDVREVLLQEIGHAEAHGRSLPRLGAQTGVPVPALQLAVYHCRCQNSEHFSLTNNLFILCFVFYVNVRANSQRAWRTHWILLA